MGRILTHLMSEKCTPGSTQRKPRSSRRKVLPLTTLLLLLGVLILPLRRRWSIPFRPTTTRRTVPRRPRRTTTVIRIRLRRRSTPRRKLRVLHGRLPLRVPGWDFNVECAPHSGFPFLRPALGERRWGHLRWTGGAGRRGSSTEGTSARAGVWWWPRGSAVGRARGTFVGGAAVGGAWWGRAVVSVRWRGAGFIGRTVIGGSLVGGPFIGRSFVAGTVVWLASSLVWGTAIWRTVIGGRTSVVRLVVVGSHDGDEIPGGLDWQISDDEKKDRRGGGGNGWV